MLSEAAVLATLLSSPTVIEAQTSCGVFYPDDMIERIECVVYANPEAGYRECFFAREVEVELARAEGIVLVGKTDCRRTRLIALLTEGEHRSCTATVDPEPDIEGPAAWQGDLTRGRQDIFVIEGYYSQRFRFTVTCGD